MVYSVDGSSGSSTPATTLYPGTDVAFGAGNFVVTWGGSVNDRTDYSADGGASWSQSVSLAWIRFYGITYGARFVAVGGAGSTPWEAMCYSDRHRRWSPTL